MISADSYDGNSFVKIVSLALAKTTLSSTSLLSRTPLVSMSIMSDVWYTCGLSVHEFPDPSPISMLYFSSIVWIMEDLPTWVGPWNTAVCLNDSIKYIDALLFCL